MSLLVSLNMGNDVLSFALAEIDKGSISLLEEKTLVSKGLVCGEIKDIDEFHGIVKNVLASFASRGIINTIHIALPNLIVSKEEKEVSISVSRKIISERDIANIENKCKSFYDDSAYGIVEMLAISNSIDGKIYNGDIVGVQAKTLTTKYRIYKVQLSYLDILRKVFSDYENINFYPIVSAFSEVFALKQDLVDICVVDLASKSTNLMIRKSGIWIKDVCFPVGVSSITSDIATAFAISGGQAESLKRSYGQALKSKCKNRKIEIPDSNLEINSRDLVTTIQARMEEIFDAVVYQLQQIGFDGVIYLTGGGSRLINADVLLEEMSALRVEHIKVSGFDSVKDAILKTPEYAVVLGLTLCYKELIKDSKPGLISRIKDYFGFSLN